MALPKDIEKIKKQATVFVIFGATGDLSRKKLFPALFTLFQSGLLPEKLKIIAASRTKHSTSQFQNSIKESVNPQDSKKWQDFAKKIKKKKKKKKKLFFFPAPPQKNKKSLFKKYR